MSEKKAPDFPYFPGKDLAIEVRDRGLKVTGLTSDIKEPMLIGLIQVVEELRNEIAELKYELRHEIAGLKYELRDEIAELKYKIKALKEQS